MIILCVEKSPEPAEDGWIEERIKMMGMMRSYLADVQSNRYRVFRCSSHSRRLARIVVAAPCLLTRTDQSHAQRLAMESPQREICDLPDGSILGRQGEINDCLIPRNEH